eukprot:gb/GECG01011696.1/.p1 GENE.gb/GECG01011696.1/~~gb/GECG01011696.1/.p1  ORF type:complete len:1457 (+),score=252.95 gb/GECG01011696.1/:1-4371(+)
MVRQGSRRRASPSSSTQKKKQVDDTTAGTGEVGSDNENVAEEPSTSTRTRAGSGRRRAKPSYFDPDESETSVQENESPQKEKNSTKKKGSSPSRNAKKGGSDPKTRNRTGKRKASSQEEEEREDDHEEFDGEEDVSSSEDEDENGDSYEPSLKTVANKKKGSNNITKKKSTPTKKPGEEGSENEFSDEDKGQPKRSRSKSRKDGGRGISKQNDLFQLICRNDVESAIARWLTVFQRHESVSLKNLLELMLVCSGCESAAVDTLLSNFSVQTFDVEEFSETLKEDQVKMQKDYPLVSKNSQLKHCLSGFISFWRHLPGALGIRYLTHNNEATVQLLDWMVHLSHSSQRSVRHVGSVSALSFGIGLIEIVHELDDKKETLSPQKGRKSPSKVSESTIEAQKKELLGMLHSLHTDVLVNRYRDVSFAVRRDSIHLFCQWLVEYPSEFLKNEYLKYFGWLLNDKVADVRKSSLSSVLQLLSTSSHFSQRMKAFLEKFRPRLLEMVRDVDDDVSVEALRVLSLMLEERFLQEGDEQEVEEAMVCHESLVVKETAAKFLLAYIPAFQPGYEPDVEQDVSSEKRKRHVRFDQLLSLIDVCERHLGALERVDEDEASLIGGGEMGVPCQEMRSIIESLWQKPGAEVLHDWNVLVGLFLEDPVAQKLSPTQQKLGATMMKEAASLLLSTYKEQGERSPMYRLWRERYSAMTEEICRNFPSLCEQHLAEPGVLAQLLGMARQIDISVLIESEYSHSLEQMLGVVKQMVKRHNVVAFVDECASLLRLFLESNHDSLVETTKACCQEILDTIAREANEFVPLRADAGKKRNRNSSNENSMFIRGVLNRAAGLAPVIPIHTLDSRFSDSGSFVKKMIEVLEVYLSEQQVIQLDQFRECNDASGDSVFEYMRPLFESVRSIMQFLFAGFCWQCHSFTKHPELSQPGSDIPHSPIDTSIEVSFEDALKAALEWRSHVLHTADRCLRFQLNPSRLSTDQMKAAEAYSLSVNMSSLHCMCDLSQLCNEHLRKTYLKQLYWSPSEDQARLIRLVAERSMNLDGDELRNCCCIGGEEYYELRRSLVMQVEEALGQSSEGGDDMDAVVFKRSLEDHLADRSSSLKVEQIMKPLCQMVYNCRIEQENPQAEFAAIVLSHAVEQKHFLTPLGGSSAAVLSKSILNIAKSHGPEQTLVVHLSILQSCFKLVMEAQRELSAAYEGQYDTEDNVDELLDRAEQQYMQRAESLHEVSKKLANSLGVGKFKGERLLAVVRMLQRAITYAVDDLQRVGFLSYLEPYLAKITRQDQTRLLSGFCDRVIDQLPEEDQENVNTAKTELKKNKTQDDIQDVNAAPWVPFAEFILSVEGHTRPTQRSPAKKARGKETSPQQQEEERLTETETEEKHQSQSERGRRSLVSAMASDNDMGISQTQTQNGRSSLSLEDDDDELLVRKPSQLERNARVNSARKGKKGGSRTKK